jgi:hypothetical protein
MNWWLTTTRTRKGVVTVEHAIYLVIMRLHFAADGWPGYLDVITEPSYIDSHAARARLKELAALYETEEKRKALATLAAEVRFYLRDVSLVQEMGQRSG